ncbi:MAG: TIM-barrel domain-containing protein [Chloroflexota bacterium]
MDTYLLFLFICLLQTALIHFHHFSPFEKESNLRAALWGAPVTPRYVAVVVLDVCAGLLLMQLVVGNWLWDIASWLRVLPVWILLTLLTAGFHHFVNDTVIRFPRYQLIAQRTLIALLIGALLVALTLLGLLVAHTAAYDIALTQWLTILPAVFVSAYALAIVVFLARALAFNARLLPVVGNFVHATLSTGMLWRTLTQYQSWLAPPTRSVTVGSWELGVGLSLVALLALAIAFLLRPHERHADAAEPPPLVVSKPERIALTHDLSGQRAVLASPDVRVEVTRVPFSIVVRNTQGDVLWRLADNGITRDWLLFKILSIPILYTGNTMKFKWRIAGQRLEIGDWRLDGDALLIRCGRGNIRIAFHTSNIVRVNIQYPLLKYQALSIAFVEPSNSHYLGFGQRFNKVDQRGEAMYFFVEEGGVGYEWLARKAPLLAPLLHRWFGARGSFPNGEQCTGFPVPFGLITRAVGERCLTNGLFWATYQPSWLTLARETQSVPHALERSRLTVLADHLDLCVCAGPTPLDAIRQYTSLTGQPALPPPWALLPWKTRTGAVVEDDVREDIRKFRELDIPLAQVGIEHWQNVRGSYEFSPEWFPHVDDLVQTARDNGYRVHIWHFPYMNAGAATHLDGVRHGYFIRNRLGLPYQQRIFHGIATVVDYSNPQAARWHGEIVKRAFHARGIQGVMTDYAESVPPDAVLYNGQSGLAMRNAYPVMYCDAMQQAARESLGDDHCIYPRAGYAATQRFVTVQWPGDQDTDWDAGDGLPAAVRAMLNVSMCGFPIHGSDVGGWYDWFTPHTTKELYLRWAEVGAYSPLMRAHGGPMGRNREPWKFDAETVEIYRALSAEHVKLFPYWYTLAQQAARDGTPIIRHPSLVWPDCDALFRVEDAWLIGDALYVAPVIQPGQTQRELLLPPGEWWSLSDSRAVRGPTRITVDAPFGRVPLFLRRGYMLPKFVSAFDTFTNAATAGRSPSPDHRPPTLGRLDDPLEVWLYPSEGEQSFTLFDGTVLHARCTEGGVTTTHNAPIARAVGWLLFGTRLDPSH